MNPPFAPADPLDPARTAAADVARDPVRQPTAPNAVQVGVCMALVSIAGDLRRMADLLEAAETAGMLHEG